MQTMLQTPENVLKLKGIFSELVHGFGINHARIYNALLTSETKTASDLIIETGVNPATTYSVLRELTRWELTKTNNTTPANYFIENPLKTLEKIHKKRDKEIEESQKKLLQLIEKDSPKTDSIIIRIGRGEQTKLFHSTTKKELKYKEELEEVKQLVEHLVQEAPIKKHYQSVTPTRLNRNLYL